MIEVIEASWPAPARVRAAATLRTGGVSCGDFTSLNLGAHVGDDPARVQENRRRLRASLALPAAPRWLTQTHGVEVATEPAAGPPTAADAAVSRRTDTVLAVLTADCLPVLFCYRDASMIGVAHAGWRGLASGILEHTVAAMGGDPGDLLVWLGPAIGAQAFEVGEDVRRVFVDHDAATAMAFVPQSTGHYLADLVALARRRLTTLGVTRIHAADACTVTDTERFFSYRRDGRCGRMATLIWLEPRDSCQSSATL